MLSSNRFKRYFLFVTLALALTLVALPNSPTLADPPPPTPVDLPVDIFGPARVFCYRVTDIKQVGDPAENNFQFEFEVLNWSNRPADGVSISLNEGTEAGNRQGSAPSLFIAGVDQTGRPIGAAGDNAQLPGGAPPTDNDWGIMKVSGSTITWGGPTAIPGLDLLTGYDGQPWPIQPDDPRLSFITFLDPNDPTNPDSIVAETIDDGPNALDGFTFVVQDFNPGEIISVNWFLLENGTPIGTANTGNAYGFGTVNIGRVDGGLTLAPVLQGNTGFDQSERSFFGGVFNPPGGTSFAIEFGAGITAPFLNPADNTFGALVNTSLIMPTSIYLPTLFKNYPLVPPTPTPTLTPTPTPTEPGSEDVRTPTPTP